MHDFSYAFITENKETNASFYQKHFGWEVAESFKGSSGIDSKSPLEFELFDKEYLESVIGIPADYFPEKSFCIWTYNSETDFLKEKEEFLSRGASEIGKTGHFLKDASGHIWQLKVKGGDL